MQWHCLKFEQLTAAQLYDIMALRQEVFVVEQTCAYQDADGKDQKSYHVWAEEECHPERNRRIDLRFQITSPVFYHPYVG